jgi:hypothetical protein
MLLWRVNIWIQSPWKICVNTLMEGKFYLNTKLEWNWAIGISLLCTPKLICRHTLQFWWTEWNKNYISHRFKLTRCLTLNNMRLQTKCQCYKIFCTYSIILQINIYFKWQKCIKFYIYHYKQTLSTQFCSATYTNMRYIEAGVQNSKNILIEWGLRFPSWWLWKLLFLGMWLCAKWLKFIDISEVPAASIINVCE